MFRFNEDGTEAGDGGLRVGRRQISPGILWKKTHRKPGEGEMQIVSGGFVEDVLGEGGGGFGRDGSDGPEEDVELGRMCGSEKPFGFCETLVEFEGGGVAGFEAF